jgi:acetylornithine deacetylase
MNELVKEAISLLRSMIQAQTFSGEEGPTADLIDTYLKTKGVKTERLHNNIIVRNSRWHEEKPTIILNSHHDTVKINNGWTKDPFGAEVEGDKLFGRGSNDAGGALVSLIATFVHYYDATLPFNLMLIASGEEENFGPNGVSSVLATLDFEPALGIIGEPTQMQLAIAEKGLIVIDGTTTGKAGHAARNTGINALYLAAEDINWIKSYEWPKVSPVLGPVKTTVTQIASGSQHNVIPDSCTYVIDCRVNEHYTLQEVLDILNDGTHAALKPRSLRWHPSGINEGHPIVAQGKKIGRAVLGSPTLSDQVHFTCPTIKIGPGISERSHTANEFIMLSEIEEGINIYIDLLKGLEI